MLFLLAGLASASEINNPGGERIPFVKLRSEVWDVVIRMTADDRARIERVKASCQGIWINACAAGVDPELRQIALNEVFKDAVKLSGDFTFCSTAVLRDIPADLARGVIEPSTEKFCQVFLDPDSVRGKRSGTATEGENALVSRLMGGSGTTSGQVRIKAPPKVDGSQSGGEKLATGERRAPGVGAGAASHGGQPAPTRSPEPESGGRTDSVEARAFIDEPSRPAEKAGRGEPPALAPSRQAEGARPAESSRPDDASPTPEPPPPQPRPSGIEFDDDEPLARVPPPPAPAPAPAIDDDLAELLAPIPTIDSQAALIDPNVPRSSSGAVLTRPTVDEVAVPAPKPDPPRPAPAPAPRGPSEFDLESAEMAGMGRLSDRGDDDDGKKKKKGKDDAPPDPNAGDREFDDYIIIDIEGLDD